MKSDNLSPSPQAMDDSWVKEWKISSEKAEDGKKIVTLVINGHELKMISETAQSLAYDLTHPVMWLRHIE